jgi:phosphoribosyl 1,2-cyclic phosphate phosphodiesterase
MDITILGSGGNTSPPMPTCQCKICREAREKGEPYARRGNSIFFHDENIMIDAPEQIWYSLNREDIKQVDYIFISHFHYDHILSLRVLQPLGIEDQPIEQWIGDLPTLVMSQNTFEKINAKNGFLSNLIENWSDIKIINDGESMEIGSLKVSSIGSKINPEEENQIFSYLFEDDRNKVLVSPDENKFLDLSRIPNLDLWIKETGLFQEDPEGNVIMTEEAWKNDEELEITFEETLQQIKEVGPEKVILTEIEEIFKRSYDGFLELEDNYTELNLKFAFDGMQLNI